MHPELSILHVEDDPLDTEMVGALLHREGLAARLDRVETMAAFQQALAQRPYALILCDYTLPGMDSREALRWAREHCPQVPFIVLSGSAGEEVAIEMLQRGAADYVLKQRLGRLGPAVRRALEQVQEHTRRSRAEAELRQSQEHQRLAVQALRQSEEKFRALFEQAAIGMGRVRFTDARWIDVNQAFCRMLGYSPQEMLATPWPQITHPEDIDIDLIPFRRMAAGELDSYTVEKRFLHKHGHPVWARLTLSLVRTPQGSPDYEIAIIENITERKQAEAAMRRQAQLIELAPAATIVRSLEGAISFWSAGAQALYGWTAQEALGRFTHELLHTQFPLPLDQIVAHLRQGGSWSGELRQRAKDGHPVVVESHWLGQFAPNGQVLELMESNMDITQRKAAQEALLHAKEELSRANADLERRVDERTADLREAIAEMEQMSYSMIHDLRAPLRAIQSFGGIVEEDPESRLSPEARDLVAKMRAAATRMDRLVVDVLNYSKVVRGALPLGPVDIGKLAREIVGTYPNLQPPRAEVWIAPDFPLLQANEAALTQCLSQLLSNAVKFVLPGVKPRIRIWAELVDRPPADQQRSTINHPLSARVFVEDNGIGIPPQLQHKLFGLFHRLDHRGEGTGMGLAIVRKAVERMGGKVGVESQPGRGSRFWLELPLVT